MPCEQPLVYPSSVFAIGEALRWIDDALQRRIGLPYVRLTRDGTILQRGRYVADLLCALDACPRFLDAGCGAGITLRLVDGHVSFNIKGALNKHMVNVTPI